MARSIKSKLCDSTWSLSPAGGSEEVSDVKELQGSRQVGRNGRRAWGVHAATDGSPDTNASANNYGRIGMILGHFGFFPHSPRGILSPGTTLSPGRWRVSELR